MNLAIWQSALIIVVVLSCVSVVMQVYGQRVMMRDHLRTDQLIIQNEQLSKQISHLEQEIEQLTSEMHRVMEENIMLNREVHDLTKDVNRLQNLFGICNPLACEFKK